MDKWTAEAFERDLADLGWKQHDAHALCCYLVDRGVISGIAWKHAHESIMVAVTSAMVQLDLSRRGQETSLRPRQYYASQAKVVEDCLHYVASTLNADPKVGRTTVISVDPMVEEIAQKTGTWEGNVRETILWLIKERKLSWRLFRYTSEIHALAEELRSRDEATS